jgi:hypothetical protein
MVDFAALRAERNENIKKMIEDECKRMGLKGPVHHTFDFNSCYCACVANGPCEHTFSGWRDIHNDNGEVCGGETVCERCGIGAMSHSLKMCD